MSDSELEAGRGDKRSQEALAGYVAVRKEALGCCLQVICSLVPCCLAHLWSAAQMLWACLGARWGWGTPLAPAPWAYSTLCLSYRQAH